MHLDESCSLQSDRCIRNFKSSKSIDQQTLWRKETPMAVDEGSKIIKGSIGSFLGPFIYSPFLWTGHIVVGNVTHLLTKAVRHKVRRPLTQSRFQRPAFSWTLSFLNKRVSPRWLQLLELEPPVLISKTELFNSIWGNKVRLFYLDSLTLNSPDEFFPFSTKKKRNLDRSCRFRLKRNSWHTLYSFFSRSTRMGLCHRWMHISLHVCLLNKDSR